MRLHRLDEWPSKRELDGMEKEALMLGELAEAEINQHNPDTIFRALLQFQVACAVTQLVGLIRRDGLFGPDDPK